ncbi:transporter substrate-binding domain-containing protein [Chitinivorax sp. B]|uniref:substrate-binding periplasmic protein n=1 Tax=Chitinivorax sp. B TaxID=2502235 RepID=UPI0014852132|nr:transporter substrate-binding domain-containing protein [Chitinivorax sp. B]
MLPIPPLPPIGHQTHSLLQQSGFTRFRRGLVMLVLYCTCMCSELIHARDIRILRPETDDDLRNGYPVALLELALKKADRQDFRLVRTQLRMVQSRLLSELEQGKTVDVVWSMTSIERELRLKPIRIPIDKGLLGWRLLLVKRNRVDIFSTIQALSELGELVAGQGHDWPDTIILKANGLTVTAGSRYEGLFKMLTTGFVDYFPRSLVEIGAEAQSHTNQGIVIEPRLALRYPTAQYYFVNKQDAELASAITTGLERAIQDGSFNALFNQYYQADIANAKLGSRRIFYLQNPLIPPETPLQRTELWFNPQEMKR